MKRFHMRLLGRQRGAVLLLVLGAIAILSILAVELAHRSNLDVLRAERSAREASFRRVINSGLEIAKGLISEGRKSDGFDFLGDPWSKPVQFELGARERVYVQVSDESGKLNIAKALSTSDGAGKTRKALARLFAYLQKSDSSHSQQWQGIDAALRKRLGIDGSDPVSPLLTLDGLREAGIPLEFVFGKAEVNAALDHPRLCDLLTIYGDGRVNLNTASVPVLYSLDEEYSDELVSQIEEWMGRSGQDEGVALKPFKDAKDLELVPGVVLRAEVNGHPQIVKNLYAKIQDQLSTQSKAFSVRIVAEIDGHRRMAFGYFEAASSGPGSLIKMLAYEEVEP
jgi:hypothetical protein